MFNRFNIFCCDFYTGHVPLFHSVLYNNFPGYSVGVVERVEINYFSGLEAIPS